VCILFSGVSFEFCICWICKLDCTDIPVVAARLPHFLPCWGEGDILTRHCMPYLHTWNGISQSVEHDFDDTEPLFDKSYSQKCDGNHTAGAFKAVPPGASEVRKHHCSTRLVCLDEQSKFLSFMAAEYQGSALHILHHTNYSKDCSGTGWRAMPYKSLSWWTSRVNQLWMNALECHQVYPAQVTGILRIAKEDGETNLADVLTECLPGLQLR